MTASAPACSARALDRGHPRRCAPRGLRDRRPRSVVEPALLAWPSRRRVVTRRTAAACRPAPRASRSVGMPLRVAECPQPSRPRRPQREPRREEQSAHRAAPRIAAPERVDQTARPRLRGRARQPQTLAPATSAARPSEVVRRRQASASVRGARDDAASSTCRRCAICRRRSLPTASTRIAQRVAQALEPPRVEDRLHRRAPRARAARSADGRRDCRCRPSRRRAEQRLQRLRVVPVVEMPAVPLQRFHRAERVGRACRSAARRE